MKSKHKPPQFEFPSVSRDTFNLFAESTTDGERLRQEAEAAETQRRLQKELEQKQQPHLL